MCGDEQFQIQSESGNLINFLTVIPAQTGMTVFHTLDAGLRRYDASLRASLFSNLPEPDAGRVQ